MKNIQEYIQEKIEDEYNKREEEQRMCNYENNDSCEHCRYQNINDYKYINTYQERNANEVERKNGQLYEYVEVVPVKYIDNVEYVTDREIYEEYPRVYRDDVRYLVKKEPVYLPEGEYIVEEEFIDDNTYDDRGNYCTCGNNLYYDDYNGEYYEYVEEPRYVYPVENVRKKKYIWEKKIVRHTSPKYKNNYSYYESQGYSRKRVNTEKSDEDQK